MRITQTFSSEFGSLTIEREPSIEERLRAEAAVLPNEVFNLLNPLLIEAADEIQRLNKKVADLEKQNCVRQLDLLSAPYSGEELGE